MLIPADRFSTLPEGCPVLNGHDGKATIFAYDGTNRRGATMYMLDFPGVGSSSYAVDEIRVDLTTPAAVRAFAPALILAVRFPEGRYNDSRFPPMPLWDVARDTYTLIGYILDSGALCAYMPRHELVTGSTPEACLLAGLKAALDAAKDAQ